MNKILFTLIIIAFPFINEAQDLLRLSDAVKILLENDYNIKVAENSSREAKNNTSISANGYLPTVNGRSAAGYKSSHNSSNYYDGSSTDVNGLNTLSYSASLNLNYTLFDGMYRSYNFEKSKELYNLSKLQVRQVIESSLLELFTSYYNVASLTESTQSLKETLGISKVRLLRARYSADYGKNTELDVLNAEVDVNTDSINLLNSKQSLANARRNLNVLMGREVTLDFSIDTTINYQVLFSLDTLLVKAQDENIRLLAAQKNLELSGFNTKLLKTNRIPTVGLSGSYVWNNSHNNDMSPIEKQTLVGPQAELSLTWNIFDGGYTRVGIQNAKIAEETNRVQQEQTQKQVERDVINAYTTYKNSLFVLEADKANLSTNKRNFDRSEEQYQLGQLTSVEYRQAQLNLLRAETRYNQSKYQVKIYELALFKLTGDILNMKF